jgi:hypothetical protein
MLSVKELTRAIESYIRDHNRNPKPFVGLHLNSIDVVQQRRTGDSSVLQ